MTTNEEANVLWQKIQQCGISWRDLQWISENLPSRLNQAWEIFKQQANRSELLAALRHIPNVSERAWEQLRADASIRELRHIIASSSSNSEALERFTQRANVSDAVKLMDQTAAPKVARQCWNIIRSAGSISHLESAMQTWAAQHNKDILKEMWQKLRPIADISNLRIILNNVHEFEDEAWQDFKSIATKEDLRDIAAMGRIANSHQLEAYEMLIRHNPTVEDLKLVVARAPRLEQEVKTRSDWITHTTQKVRVMPPVALEAAQMLLNTELGSDELYLLLKHVDPYHAELRAQVEEAITKNRKLDQSPTQELLKKLKEKEE